MSWFSPGKIGQVAWWILNDAGHRRVALSCLISQYVDFVDNLTIPRFTGDCLHPFLTSAPCSQFNKNEISYEIIVHSARPSQTHRAGCVENNFSINYKLLILLIFFQSKNWHAACNISFSPGRTRTAPTE
jgi:hypothetical protein